MPRAERVHRLVGVREAAARRGLARRSTYDRAALEPQRAEERAAGGRSPARQGGDVAPRDDARRALDLLERRRQPPRARRRRGAPRPRAARRGRG